MSESSPLAGLTSDQADEAIERLQAKVDEGQGGKAAKEHLAEMKRARKRHEEPTPVEEQNPGTVVQAGTAGGA